MGLKFMEHILILTHDPEGTRDWFCTNLGFRSGDHPDFGFPVYWLYIGNQDVVHIGKAKFSEHQDTYLKTPSDQSNQDYSAAGALGSARIDMCALTAMALMSLLSVLQIMASSSVSAKLTTQISINYLCANPSTASRLSLTSLRKRL